MKIINILNHNAVLTHDPHRDEILLILHRGVGFGKKLSEHLVVPNDARVYHLQKTNAKGNTDSMIHTLDPRYIELSGSILDLVKQEYQHIDENILLPLADHIGFAVSRMEQGVAISNPFGNEIRLLYPESYALGLKALPLIEASLGIVFNEDEIGYLAIHIHAAINYTNHEGLAVAIIIKESIQEIADEFNKVIDENGLSYSRLMVHMKYLLARLREHEVLSLDMESYTQSMMPRSYDVAKKIISKIEKVLGRPVPKVETGYLAVHIERILN